MKENIHPEIHTVTARCACGYSFQTTSTSPEVSMSICSGCHPFYTGAQKFVDTAGRIEKFAKRYQKKAEPVVEKKAEPVTKAPAKKKK